MERLPYFFWHGSNKIHGASQFIEDCLNAASAFLHDPSREIESPAPQEFQERFMVDRDAVLAKFLLEPAIAVAGMFSENLVED